MKTDIVADFLEEQGFSKEAKMLREYDILVGFVEYVHAVTNSRTIVIDSEIQVAINEIMEAIHGNQ